MNEDVSQNVRTLLRERITSFELLEVLMFLHARPGEYWSATMLAGPVRLSEEEVHATLESLQAQQLAEMSPMQASGGYRYAPHDAALASAVDELVQNLGERRAAILSLMSTNAIERVRSAASSAFADAFLLKGKPKDA